MIDVETARFTVGVFQDVSWAEKGLEALKRAGLPAEALSILAKETPEVAALVDRALGMPAQQIGTTATGPLLARGAILEALQGSTSDLSRLGLAGTMRRVGFQAHDGQIFETLVARGGVLVAIHSEPRAADALAVLHSYGAGNAAIGAWTGRV